MEASHFDALARSLTAAGSRRRALTGLLLGSLGFLGASVEETAAKNCKKIKNKKKRKKCLAKANGCTPNCDRKICGDDGCGGSCGSCVAPETCQNGDCKCIPRCAPTNACGPDGCYGSCGTCTGDPPCSERGVCECGDGMELCGGNCRSLCTDGSIRPPNGACDCCYPKGTPFPDEFVCIFLCCWPDCDPNPSGGWMCAGFPLCSPCTANEQCIEGAECQGGRCMSVEDPTFCP
jgi:hypothetical protein